MRGLSAISTTLSSRFASPSHVRSSDGCPDVPAVCEKLRTCHKANRGSSIKVHPRKAPGGRSTDASDYPAEKAIYALRDVDALIAKSKEKGVHIGVYAERLLGGPLPWTKMRQAYALLGLCQKYGEGRVEAICQSALAFDVVSVPRIASMLKSAAKPVSPAETQGKVVQLTPPRFARPTGHFETLSRSSKKEGL